MACVEMRDIETGQSIFVEIARQGLLERNIYIGSTLVHMYASCNKVSLAQEVFDQLGMQTVVTWNALISGYTDHGCGEQALICLQQMREEGIAPDVVTLVCSIKACGVMLCINRGQEIHSEIIKKGLLHDSFFIGSSLVNMYIKCCDFETAQQVFGKLPTRNTVMWNALISGCAEYGQGQESLVYFEQMLKEGLSPDHVTFIYIMKACSYLGDILIGQKMHIYILMLGLEWCPFVGSSLVDMYSKCGSLTHAEYVFSKLPEKDIVDWTALIAGFVENGDGNIALHIFDSMHSEKISGGAVSFSCAFRACSEGMFKSKGLELHIESLKKGLESESLVSRSLVDFYAKCGALNEAQNVFDRLLVFDVFCLSTLIMGFIDWGLNVEALERFKHMQIKYAAAADAVTLVCFLKACAMIGAISDVKELHAQLCKKGLETSSFVSSILVDAYTKCSFFADAEKVNDGSISSWNAIISGFVDYGHDEAAISCFKDLNQEGLSPDSLTCVCVLKAVCSLGAIEEGKRIHAELVVKGLEMELLISNTLIDMYSKCSLMGEALNLFYKCPVQTVVLWTALIAGCIEHGHGELALCYFDQMQDTGISPSAATFSCVLRACCKIGVMERAEQLLVDVLKKGMLEQNIFLCSTVVDIYAKQGYLLKAQKVFNMLPVQDSVSWAVLIAGYSDHGFRETALDCFDQMQNENVVPVLATFISTLKACGSIRAVGKGQTIHSEIIMKGLEKEINIYNTLVDMYSKFSLLEEARILFDNFPVKNIASWAALVKGYMDSGNNKQGLNFFEQMEQVAERQGSVALMATLKACVSVAALAKGLEIHSEIIMQGLEEEPLVGNALIDLYTKLGAPAEAEQVFSGLLSQDVVAWTSLIMIYSQTGMTGDVLRVFNNIMGGSIKPDSITVLAILNAFSHTGLVEEGLLYFELACVIDNFVPNLEHFTCLLDLLGRAGLVDRAVKLTIDMPIHPNMIVWLTLLGSCRKWGHLEYGKDAFQHAVNLNENESAAYVCLANICVEYSDRNEDEMVF
ncbi:hypothetical protein KP509_33G045700 [Ceratopteris richardii]|nr:hypothetical protein KP509_33G045700 [Ceratopteris richardii]